MKRQIDLILVMGKLITYLHHLSSKSALIHIVGLCKALLSSPLESYSLEAEPWVASAVEKVDIPFLQEVFFLSPSQEKICWVAF